MRLALLMGLFAAACSPNSRNGGGPGSGSGSGSGSGVTTCPVCTDDKSGFVDCDGMEHRCPDTQLCTQGVCEDSCMAAEANNSSVGCDYYAVDMDAASGPPRNACYAVFVANTSKVPAHITASWKGQDIDLSKYAKLPIGQGQGLMYGNYDPVAGLMPGEVAILFLDYVFDISLNVACPTGVQAALGAGPQLSGTGVGNAFHLTTDQPVVAYQMLPYGGGAAAATGASLLIPSSAWGTEYVAVSAFDTAAPPIPIPMGPSHDIVAKEDHTTITITPISDIVAGGGLAAGPKGQPYKVVLNQGMYLQLTQAQPLSGSSIVADKPVGVFGGHQIMSIDRCCGDHGEQMLAPVQALGSEYVAAPHPDRKPTPGEQRLYRIYGAVDGTALTYDPAGLGPATVGKGGLVEIRTDKPFVIKSQDSDHPFSMFTYMTGAGDDMTDGPDWQGGWGDPDFVRLVPPAQYMFHYVFFTDVTYPFTGLTIVRAKKDNAFSDVTLDCYGSVDGWEDVGDYQITHIKLVDHWNGQHGCNNGVHVMDSTAPFGVWVWGWGSEDTNTGWVSYGYPAGENVQPINQVILQ
jgi:hypothetical protein